MINDGTDIMWMDEAGNAVDAVTWEEARRRLVAYLQTDTAAYGWAENRAEDLLCAIFTGGA